MYLFGSFLLLSLSLFSLLLQVVRFASASETNRLGLTEFLLQGGRGRVCTIGEGRGLSKIWMMRKVIIYTAKELTTLFEWLKIMVGW